MAARTGLPRRRPLTCPARHRPHRFRSQSRARPPTGSPTPRGQVPSRRPGGCCRPWPFPEATRPAASRRCSPTEGGKPVWLHDATSSLLASFARGRQADEQAVAAALAEAWSNGQTEEADQQAQADQASNVRPRQARPPPSSPNRCGATSRMTCTEIESEPLLHADLHVRGGRSRSLGPRILRIDIRDTPPDLLRRALLHHAPVISVQPSLPNLRLLD